MNDKINKNNYNNKFRNINKEISMKQYYKSNYHEFDMNHPINQINYNLLYK